MIAIYSVLISLERHIEKELLLPARFESGALSWARYHIR